MKKLIFRGFICALLLMYLSVAVTARSISKEAVSLEYDTVAYTGGKITPAVRVEGMTEGKDYYVTYVNNRDQGVATVMIDDVNDSCPTVYKYFDILPCNMSNTKITLSYTSGVYSGKKKKPAVKVTFKGKTLKAGKDYKVTYKNNVNVGKASVTVTGLGNFTGKRVKSFYIKPTKVKKLKSKKETANTIQLTWNKSKMATQYRIYIYENKKWVYAGKTAKNRYTVRKLESDKVYKLRVRAVTKLENKTLYGAYSEAIAVRTGLSGNDKVYISPRGEKYHRKACSYLKGGKSRVKYSYARKEGYTACSYCFGD